MPLLHVDGGHFAEEALSDLLLADASVVEAGAVVIDDPFSSAWPGVTEATFTFLKAHPEWVTVALGFNKQVLARRGYASTYERALNAPDVWRYVDRRVYDRKTLPIYGAPATTIFYIPSYRQRAQLTEDLARLLWFRDAVRRRLRR
jgi:hypothetical protein